MTRLLGFFLATLGAVVALSACEPDCPSYLRTEGDECVAPGAPDAGATATETQEAPQSTFDASSGAETGSRRDAGAAENETRNDASTSAGSGGSAGDHSQGAAGAGGMSMERADAGTADSGAVQAATCGDGNREGGELCDGADCPTECAKNDNACVGARLEGAAKTCDARCVPTEVTECANNDKCCPTRCNFGSDNDCSPTCGDGELTGVETCEPDSTAHSCPTLASCDDGDPCTADSVTGDPAQCSAKCAHAPLTRMPIACDDGEPCTDDMAVESATACVFECQASTPRARTGSCVDSDPCTDDTPVPSTTSCEYRCPHARREPEAVDCSDSDPCTDDAPELSTNACEYTCPRRRQNPREISCDDGDQCTDDSRVLSSTRCAYECRNPRSNTGRTGTPEPRCDNNDNDCDGETDEGVLNECGGCGSPHYESQAVPPGQPCVYFWDNSNSGDCATTGTGKCIGTDTVVCDAPKPACAP
jgi:hypothetical protein